MGRGVTPFRIFLVLFRGASAGKGGYLLFFLLFLLRSEGKGSFSGVSSLMNPDLLLRQLEKDQKPFVCCAELFVSIRSCNEID